MSFIKVEEDENIEVWNFWLRYYFKKIYKNKKFKNS